MTPRSRWLLVVSTLVLLTVSTPAAVADDETPVLWSGTIQTGSDRPAPADVTAYLQPTADTTVSEEGVQLTPVSSTTAGPDGRFTLRASYDDRIRAAEDRAGWISVLVVAMTADGMSMATDSVRFDAPRRRWSTRPAEAEPEGAVKAQEVGVDAGVSERPDRPAVMTLHHSPGPAEPRFHATAARHKICYMKKGAAARDVGVTPVTVGELDLDQNWGGQFNYTDTRTSTFEVGFKYEREGVWSGGGTASFSKDGSSESINPMDPARHYRHHFYRAEMMFSTFQMDCGGRTGYSLRPTMWTGGMRREPARTMACDRRYMVPVVGGGGTFVRQEGSSQAFSGAFSILGFTGGATSVNSNAVRHAWLNQDPRTRNLCGVSDFPSKNSRVVSLP